MRPLVWYAAAAIAAAEITWHPNRGAAPGGGGSQRKTPKAEIGLTFHRVAVPASHVQEPEEEKPLDQQSP